ncbi:mitochondrial ATP-dependent RNA helicase Suv3 [Blastomyces dermatitidis ER-3]|uniref:RNA helicase n=1 Tax=Ajellomyces dermatitidis (strain ER-3 / ATCC MYA-2586) TaxID=559297 RepID=A0ABP2ENX5_AJEDR|nr:mitochondrial ATP-dependent RNA helicase Suv3 [Blastomyces dermatitidis ER-3]EEQ83241.2 mitochondrial ATP-dependent RNA helicase Suv3 [Blastomyces dermatitidis ER-3]
MLCHSGLQRQLFEWYYCQKTKRIFGRLSIFHITSMQVWRAPQGRCLLCVFRPGILPLNRAFSTTSAWQRSKSKAKKQARRPNAQVIDPADPDSALPEQVQTRLPPHIRQRNARRSATGKAGNLASVVLTAVSAVRLGFQRQGQIPGRWAGFEEFVTRAVKAENLSPLNAEDSEALNLRGRLERTFVNSGPAELTKALKQEFKIYNYDVNFSSSLKEQRALADLRNPTEWYPAARSLHRTIHLHVGPTNSGKTYHALKRLEKAKTGFYAGPLRLLAHEIYTRLNAKGIPCGLVTGDEVRISQDQIPGIYSNTVEMAPFGQDVEVGVIDEIQMIADPHRGWAWTRALLGARAHELHLCGEERVVPLIRDLAGLMGDKLEIHHYERLNPLKAMSRSLKGNLSNLQKGDCVVAFSRIGIHGLKQEIEKATGRRAAIVYGSLPAEIRSQQADLFNDPNNDYDFLVASDAIGMGLNLSCKRIIFESVVRRLPTGLTRLTVSQVKQIGGRAGRYRSAKDTANTNSSKIASSDKEAETNVGFVTSLEDVDLPYIRKALDTEPEPILAAGLLPPDHIVKRFSEHFPPGTPFAYILQRLHNIAQVDSSFFLSDGQGHAEAAEAIDSIKGLSMDEKLVFLSAPTHMRDPQMSNIFREFVRCVAENRSGDLLEIDDLPIDVLDKPVSGDKGYLATLETLHRSLVLYLWLSYRCGGVFTNRALATHVKSLTEIKMDRALTEFSANRHLRKATSLRRQYALQRQTEMREKAFAAESEGVEIDFGNIPEAEVWDDMPEQKERLNASRSAA